MAHSWCLGVGTALTDYLGKSIVSLAAAWVLAFQFVGCILCFVVCTGDVLVILLCSLCTAAAKTINPPYAKILACCPSEQCLLLPASSSTTPCPLPLSPSIRPPSSGDLLLGKGLLIYCTVNLCISLFPANSSTTFLSLPHLPSSSCPVWIAVHFIKGCWLTTLVRCISISVCSRTRISGEARKLTHSSKGYPSSVWHTLLVMTADNFPVLVFY